MPGVPATPCKKGYKKLKTRLHEAQEGSEGDYSKGYSLARMQKRLFRGPTDRARDIIGLRFAHIYIYDGSTGREDLVHTTAVANNYSGQLDIPRAYKHERARAHTHTVNTSAPICLSPHLV